MPEEPKDSDDVKVVDRRRFTSAGERRPGAELRPEPPPSPAAAPAPSAPPAAAPRTETTEERTAREAYDGQRPPRDYKVDFESLVMSLSTSAMYQLGLVEYPPPPPPPPPLPLPSRRGRGPARGGGTPPPAAPPPPPSGLPATPSTCWPSSRKRRAATSPRG